jgi:nicotinamidase/pyrazinamidase
MNEIEYDKATALLVVDMQNDFAHPEGSLYVDGGEDVVRAVNREIEKAEAAGALVVYTQDWHPPVTPHFEKDGGIWPVHCVGDTWGAEYVNELRVAGASIKKGTGGEDGYSGFTVRHPETGHETDTEMADLLEARGITRVVVVGLALDYCVKDTAIDAAELGLPTTVLMEATRPVDLRPGDGDRATEAMRAAGVNLA